MQQDHLILVLVSWSLFIIVVPASAAPSQVAKPINTAIENQHSHESLPGDAEKQKSKPERVFTKDESNEPVQRLNGNYGKVKWDDALDQEEQQQPRVDPKLDDFPEYEEQQPRVDPKIRDTPEQEVQAARVDPKFKDNPEQEEQQARVDPKFKDTPEQEEQQARVDPKFKDTPEQEEQQARVDPKFKDTPEHEKQPKADPKIKDTPEQEGQQARADPKIKDTPEQEEQPKADPKIKDTPEQEGQQARADPKIKDTPEQEEQQPRDDPKLTNTRDHNNELSVANSDYDEPTGQINKPNVNGPGKAKAETRTQNLSKDSKLSEVSDDNMKDTQNPGDTEVQKDTDTSNTAFAVVKEDGTSNTGRESAGGNSSSLQNSDVKDREEPEGDIQRKDPGNTQSRPSIPSSISSNLPVTPLPTSKLQGVQDGNIYPKGSKKESSATKTSTTTTTVSSLPIVEEIAKPDDYLTGGNEVAKPSNSQSENDSPYDDYNNIMDPREEEEFEVKPARSENAPPEVNNGGKFRDDEDSHFFAYFLTIMVTAIIFYLVFHNKQRIIALIIEGRAPRSSRTRRSSSRAKYHKLDNNLEEAITATKGSKYDRMY